jgi:hypothetical protein
VTGLTFRQVQQLKEIWRRAHGSPGWCWLGPVAFIVANVGAMLFLAWSTYEPPGSKVLVKICPDGTIIWRDAEGLHIGRGLNQRYRIDDPATVC